MERISYVLNKPIGEYCLLDLMGVIVFCICFILIVRLLSLSIFAILKSATQVEE